MVWDRHAAWKKQEMNIHLLLGTSIQRCHREQRCGQEE